MKTQDELREYLVEIARRSSSGKILWSKVNPTTYRWKQVAGDGQELIVSLQKADTPKAKMIFAINNANSSSPSNLPESIYLFQVFDKKISTPLVSLSTDERPEFEGVLSAMYERAEKSVDLAAGQILKKLLD